MIALSALKNSSADNYATLLFFKREQAGAKIIIELFDAETVESRNRLKQQLLEAGTAWSRNGLRPELLETGIV